MRSGPLILMFRRAVTAAPPPPANDNRLGWYFNAPEASGHLLTAGFF